MFSVNNIIIQYSDYYIMSSNKPLVSVIIPSYNRFSTLNAAIQSIQDQTYPNIEIIVVNDASTDNDYYSKRIKGVTMIHLSKNTREIFGYPCAGYVRNIGARISQGEYLAFLDDDDIWLPRKIETQIEALTNGAVGGVSAPPVSMSCTDGYIGYEPWHYLLGSPNSDSGLKIYNKEHYFDILCNIYDKDTSAAAVADSTKFNLSRDGFPKIWCEEFINIHNCLITSSVVMKRALFEKMSGFRELRNGEEDYDLWKRAVNSGESVVYIDEPQFYYLLKTPAAARSAAPL